MLACARESTRESVQPVKLLVKNKYGLLRRSYCGLQSVKPCVQDSWSVCDLRQ